MWQGRGRDGCVRGRQPRTSLPGAIPQLKLKDEKEAFGKQAVETMGVDAGS